MDLLVNLSIRRGVGSATGNFLDAATGLLQGKTAVQTQSAVNIDASPAAIGTILAVTGAVVGVAWMFTRGRRAPAPRRRKRRRA